MSRERPHAAVNVVSTSRSDNKMRGMLKGEYQLPYPMVHMLEIERWVALFHPEPLFSEVKGAISYIEPVAEEGVERACEGCGEVKETGFDHEAYFTDDEYLRLLSRSRACSVECAIKYAFSGEYAPSVDEVKANPEAYKTLGLVEQTVEDIRHQYYE